ncbi:unnamed protein product [Sphacelaria rigidula]
MVTWLLLSSMTVRAFIGSGFVPHHGSSLRRVSPHGQLVGRQSPWRDTVRLKERTPRRTSINETTRLRAEDKASDGVESESGEGKGQSTAMVLVETPDNGKGIKRVLKAVARFFGAGKEKPNLKQLGLYAVLSYGFVSNASYAICTCIAWFISSKKSGLSPLAAGQWQLFLTCYAGLFAVNNVLRVPRFGLAVALAPTFDRFIAYLMKKSGRGKAFATGMCVFLVNVIGTLTLIVSGILLASIASGLNRYEM